MGRRPLPSTVAMRDQALAVVRDAYPAAVTGREVAASLPATIPCRHGPSAPFCASCKLSGFRRPNEAEARRYLSALERETLVVGLRPPTGPGACILWKYVVHEDQVLDAWWEDLAAWAPEEWPDPSARWLGWE